MNSLTRRAALARAIAATTPAWAAKGAMAQAQRAAEDEAYPTRPVKIVVPFPPAGSTDIIARHVAERLGRLTGQGFVVDNKSGASANIGATFVARSAADGYTLLLGTSSTQAVNAHLFKDPGYDGIKDFAPVSLVVKVPTLIVASPDLPVRNLTELIAYTRNTPLPYGHPSTGSSKHFAAEVFRLKSGARLTPVAYKGSAPMLNDLLGGHIKIAFDEPLTSLQHIRAGRMVPLAITGPQRWPSLPNVPRVSELGGALSDYEITGWFGILAPAATPTRIVRRLNQFIVRALSDKEFRDLLYTQGAEPVGSTVEDYTDFIAKEYQRYGEVIKATGMTI
ncbi:MAG: tripartite tricarboxylate transporter substrate binding protein [Burkholderiaceae bacterium]|nr:tripartite tricarboxylate transporter substrate binding protein [Burkholderiaceae bacterium]